MIVLSANDLGVRLGERLVLDGCTFALGPGEFVLLAGRNGAGKSTALRCLIGAQRPERGQVSLGGRPIAAWAPRERACEVGYVPQETEMAFDFTGRELVTMGRHPHRGRSEDLTAADEAAVDRALAEVDAQAFAHRSVTTLSGGEQRRIAVARALATEAPLLLLDEPTNNLDLEHALRLVALLKRLAAAGRGVLVVSHDLNLIAPACDRIVLLHEGKVAVDAAPEEALAEANLRAVFGVTGGAATGFFPRKFGL